MLQLAVFNSHPIQHFAPWWKEVAPDPSVRIKVYYYSQANLKPYYDPGFGQTMRYDVDLLGGYEHAFLPRAWPFRDPTSLQWYALNGGIDAALRERPWDGVLLFGYNLLNNWKVLRRCRRLGIPVLYFSDSNARVAFQRAGWKLLLRNYLVRKFFRQVAGFLSPSASNAEYLMSLGAPREKIWRCPIPIDVGRFAAGAAAMSREDRARLRQRYGLGADDFVLVSSGKLIERKAPLDLVDAVRSLGDPRVKALFIGTGPLEEEVRRRGGECVRMAGFVNQEEIPRVLAAADAAALPASYDLHPLAVIEAMAVGLPVVASDVIALHGPEEVLRHCENGFVYPTGDVRELASLIARLKANPDLWRTMGERAAELAREQSPRGAAAALVRCLGEIRGSAAGSERDGLRALPQSVGR
jgi:glycosyltransferase involved in cell wall biosynthesis